MKVFTITVEEIEAFSYYDEELIPYPIQHKTSKENVLNSYYNFVGHFFKDLDFERPNAPDFDIFYLN